MSKIANIDFGLYVITDADVAHGRVHEEVVRLALEGGATVIQYRDKRAPLRWQMEVGRRLRDLTRQHGASLIVNDRADLALAVEADGVQVGPEDLPPDVVRKIVGPDMVIGASADNPQEAREAEARGADYIVARPVFRTRWKSDRGPTMGAEGLGEIVRAVNVPVIGVGGINFDNLPLVFKAGAAGPGITSAIVSAEDPTETTRKLRSVLDSYRKQGSTVGDGAQN